MSHLLPSLLQAKAKAKVWYVAPFIFIRSFLIHTMDESPTLVLVKIEEDTKMGNPNASSAIPDTNMVSFLFLADIVDIADEIIACIAQMSINDKVEIVVNKDPTAGNIVEGHKIASKVKKTKGKENLVSSTQLFASRSPHN